MINLKGQGQKWRWLIFKLMFEVSVVPGEPFYLWS